MLINRVLRHAVALSLSWCCLGVGIGFMASGIAVAAGDAEQGQELAEDICAACHGANGNSVNPQWPKLAGQHAAYLAKQLYDFQSGEQRDNAIMYVQAEDLDDDDIANVAAYFAAQQIALGSADPQLIERGESLYRGGDPERGIAACSACHGPRGLGNEAANFPRLSGQHQEYLSIQLNAFRSGERANDSGQMMRNVAAKLNDDDIAALASYLQGLR